MSFSAKSIILLKWDIDSLLLKKLLDLPGEGSFQGLAGNTIRNEVDLEGRKIKRRVSGKLYY